MTSPDRVCRTRRLIGATLLAASVLSGCTLGEASSFAGRAEASCRRASTAIGPASTPATPREQMQQAIDRYGDVERVVAEVSSDVGFPDGARGAALRRDWIDPARQSLRAGWDDLGALQKAVAAGDGRRSALAYRRAIEAGTTGVNTTALRAEGMVRCAALFTVPG